MVVFIYLYLYLYSYIISASHTTIVFVFASHVLVLLFFFFYSRLKYFIYEQSEKMLMARYIYPYKTKSRLPSQTEKNKVPNQIWECIWYIYYRIIHGFSPFPFVVVEPGAWSFKAQSDKKKKKERTKRKRKRKIVVFSFSWRAIMLPSRPYCSVAFPWSYIQESDRQSTNQEGPHHDNYSLKQYRERSSTFAFLEWSFSLYPSLEGTAICI